MDENTQKIVDRLVKILDIFESNKPLYDELDEHTMALVKMGHMIVPLKDGRNLVITDNYAGDKNCAWRAGAIRRFDPKAVEPKVKK